MIIKSPTLSKPLIQKASQALLKVHEKKASNPNNKDLLSDEKSWIFVQFSLLQVPLQRSTVKPKLVQIPHPIRDVEDDELEICLIVKDDETKNALLNLKDSADDVMNPIKKILTLPSLRKKYKLYKQQRELMNRFSFFIADDRILPMLSAALGKNFIAAKKQPIPVNLKTQLSSTKEVTVKLAPLQIAKAYRNTHLLIPSGTCVSVRVAHSGMNDTQITENVVAVTESVGSTLSWKNIVRVQVQIQGFVGLPFYNKSPEELVELRKLAGDIEEVDVEENKKMVDEIKGASLAKIKKKRSPLERALEKSKEADKKATNKSDKKKRSRTESDLDKRSNIEAIDKAADKISASAKKKKETPLKKLKASVETPKEGKKAAEESTAKKSKKSIKLDTPEASNEGAEFVASKKFKGSKKGYAFYKGKQGLGYYIDIVPKPDKMALEAFARIATRTPSKGKKGGKSPRAGSTGKKKRVGRR